MICHISYPTLLPKFTSTLQFFTGIHLEDQQSSNDMENILMYSAAAQFKDIQTVDWNQVCITTSSDVDTLSLLSIIEEDIPDHRYQLLSQLRDYHQLREHLCSIEGIIIYKDRIIIPPSLRYNSLMALHTTHQGVSSIISRVEALIFWLGATTDIPTTRANCNQMAPSHPPTPPLIAAYPF